MLENTFLSPTIASSNKRTTSHATASSPLKMHSKVMLNNVLQHQLDQTLSSAPAKIAPKVR